MPPLRPLISNSKKGKESPSAESIYLVTFFMARDTTHRNYANPMLYFSQGPCKKSDQSFTSPLPVPPNLVRAGVHVAR